ncbi:M56 family metallopeptidase [Rhodococcus opacus]|uniref:M56 family metallopeptidase n=1 Tax=Rhodococcus opacus TaxID=37919 RepID=UPI002949D727|nr:M56 family metallopeptidase [Rhodococcus opacus]MDV6245404.1 M56 family metallopeptidase [Rhodococcus opacus]
MPGPAAGNARGADTTYEMAGVAAAAAAVSATAWISCRLAVGLVRLRLRTHGHARRARLIGRRVRGIDAVVIDNPERAAYCAAGRPHAVVITTAALAALDDRQIQAVLARERAHSAGHHAPTLAVLRVLATSLPGIILFTAGAVQVARLLEMCADDRAARAHGSRTLLSGLLALSAPAQVPDGALGAGNIALLDRAGRLASPPPRSATVREGAGAGVVGGRGCRADRRPARAVRARGDRNDVVPADGLVTCGNRHRIPTHPPVIWTNAQVTAATVGKL